MLVCDEWAAGSPDGLRAHASRISGEAELAGQARSAAAGLDLGGGAFGILCNFLVLPLQALSAPAIGYLGGVAEALDACGTALTACADNFEQTEQDVASSFDKIGRQAGMGW